ncbi:DegT/DnrJ/EryC1/StrS family aminotransferase [Geobacter pelophilus]|uniref:DegT/DnrJ/EryC1/StrS family aminotransferase n=1 Tax=Geoanaerobacter pelophilus TaxID=60036 RepID=A0AAW4LBS5_9BACT|nr:DegT/DnrJ/EryC1/StrS family aminotransferase [Geoanaerobacter pelophilus]MBT0666548.1 DegT/DnrJ/EryC1/StrS family aminotransferase [Geoanaerobacter pelophilus]
MIPVNEPLLDGNEGRYLQECIDSGWISSEGPFVERFEAEMAARTGRKFAFALTNGTTALELAMAALRLEPGSMVVMPTFCIISCVAAVIRNGCIPLFVDADPLTWNLDIEKLAELLKDQIERQGNRKLKAIMAVHTYGLPVDMDPLLVLADRYGLKVIEDAAEMHGQSYRGVACGGFGDLSVFSFYPNKLVTTGEGGMVLTDDPLLAERCRSLRNLCFQPGRRFVHEELGYNFRMSNLQAAVGVAQLERLDMFVARKRAMGARYDALLADCNGLQLPHARTDYADNIYWVYGVVLGDEVATDALGMMGRLAERGIGTRPFFWPMHEQPVLQRMGTLPTDNYRFPVAERLARRGFYLPSGIALSESQIEEVSSTVVAEIAKAGR